MRHIVGLVALVLISASCGSDSGAGTITVIDPWTRPTPPGVDEAAIYMTIENDSPVADRLLSARSSGCMVVTPHLTEITDGVSRMTASGEDELDMASGARITMEPNGMHLMCLGVVEALTEGSRLPVTLQFAYGPSLDIEVAVERR